MWEAEIHSNMYDRKAGQGWLISGQDSAATVMSELMKEGSHGSTKFLVFLVRHDSRRLQI